MPNKFKTKMSANRSFGLLFFFVFLIISLWPLLNEGPIRIWSIVIAIIFLILGLVNSKLLTPFCYAFLYQHYILKSNFIVIVDETYFINHNIFTLS